MSELLTFEMSGEGSLLLFSVLLLYAAIDNQQIEVGQRVALIYIGCFTAISSNSVSQQTVALGSLAVLFLVLEVFSTDSFLVRRLTLVQKVVHYGYCVLIELYGAWFYCLLFASPYLWECETITGRLVFMLFLIALVAVTSRRRFASKAISEIHTVLQHAAEDPATWTFTKRDRKKIQILLHLEDRTYYSRNDNEHLLRLGYMLKKASLLLEKRGGGCSNKAKLKALFRGHATIEMQLVRNIGLESGSYQLRIRRKIFEMVMTPLSINSYINQLDQESDARENIQDWLLRCYLNVVSVKIGQHIIRPKEASSTFRQLFDKEFEETSEEQFFVWCLGLPNYLKGVGENAVDLHSETIEKFELDRRLILATIDEIREQEDS